MAPADARIPGFLASVLLTENMSSPISIPPHYHLAVSWEDVHRDCATLAGQLTARGPFQGIVAVARGGLVPAALVARALNIRVIETVSIATYDGAIASEPRLLKLPAATGDGEGWLVIDDLVDRGTTMRVIRKMLPKAHVGVLYAKPEGRPLADIIVRQFPQDSWLDFPWEMDPPT
jgi:xanthine phosphoribosyltransferase